MNYFCCKFALQRFRLLRQRKWDIRWPSTSQNTLVQAGSCTGCRRVCLLLNQHVTSLYMNKGSQFCSFFMTVFWMQPLNVAAGLHIRFCKFFFFFFKKPIYLSEAATLFDIFSILFYTFSFFQFQVLFMQITKNTTVLSFAFISPAFCLHSNIAEVNGNLLMAMLENNIFRTRVYIHTTPDNTQNALFSLELVLEIQGHCSWKGRLNF